MTWSPITSVVFICREQHFALDRYAPRNENFILVRSLEPEARSRNLHVELKAAGDPKHCTDPFWLLTSGFIIPPLFGGISRAQPLPSLQDRHPAQLAAEAEARRIEIG
jgi:hypothetical protein